MSSNFLVWSMRLELTRVNHTPLKRTRLPFRHDHVVNAIGGAREGT